MSDALSRFPTGEVIEVYPGEDFDVLYEEKVDVKYKIEDGWLAFCGLVRCLATCLGGSAHCESYRRSSDNSKHYIIRFDRGRSNWSDPI